MKDVTQLVLARRTRMCNFLEYKGLLSPSHRPLTPLHLLLNSFKGSRAHGATDTKVIYRRYASLFFICSISPGDNELVTLEVIHRYVEVLDRYFGNVGLALPFRVANWAELIGVRCANWI